MIVRFLADADLNRAIMAGVRRIAAEIDFMTAQEAGLEGRGDSEVHLVSHDRRTMPVHFLARLRSGRISPGVFLVRQRVGAIDYHLSTARAITRGRNKIAGCAVSVRTR